VNRVPLVKTIYTALKGSQDGQLREDFFRDLLRRGYTSSDAEDQLARAIDWGRYGELYEHEAHTENLILTA
jgi:NitT/TauT family transport system ATP-binding protein